MNFLSISFFRQRRNPPSPNLPTFLAVHSSDWLTHLVGHLHPRALLLELLHGFVDVLHLHGLVHLAHHLGRAAHGGGHRHGRLHRLVGRRGNDSTCVGDSCAIGMRSVKRQLLQIDGMVTESTLGRLECYKDTSNGAVGSVLGGGTTCYYFVQQYG